MNLPGELQPGEFHLQIEFSGLCLFVRRRDALGVVNPTRVTVLMPDARRQPNVDVMRHHDLADWRRSANEGPEQCEYRERYEQAQAGRERKSQRVHGCPL